MNNKELFYALGGVLALMEVLGGCVQPKADPAQTTTPEATTQRLISTPTAESGPISEKRKRGLVLESLGIKIISGKPLLDHIARVGDIDFIRLTPNYTLTLDPVQLPGFIDRCGVQTAGKKLTIYFTDQQSQVPEIDLAQTTVFVNLDDVVQTSSVSLDVNFEVGSKDREKAFSNLVNLNVNSAVANVFCIRSLRQALADKSVTQERLRGISEQGFNVGSQVFEEMFTGQTRPLIEVKRLTYPSIN